MLAEDNDEDDDCPPEPELENEEGNRTRQDEIIEAYKARVRNRASAMRAFCVQCMGGYVKEVAKCTAEATCPLWPFRMGKNPHGKPRGNPGWKKTQA